MQLNIIVVKWCICCGFNTPPINTVLTVLMGGARASVCGRSGRFCQVCAFFPRKPICRTDVGGDGSGGCFSAAAGQLHHSITL